MPKLTRRGFAKSLNFLCLPWIAKARAEQSLKITHGFSIGEVTQNRAILWARVNAEARLRVDLSRQASFTEVMRFTSDLADKKNDYNLKIYLDKLKPDTRYFVKCWLGDDLNAEKSEAHLTGQFKTAENGSKRNIRFLWSGDTCGQGFGIDSHQGGYLTYDSMLGREPDFFVHCGDQIYADNPLQATKTAEAGLIWKNWLSSGKLKVAETLQEFRENFYYNFNDKHMSTFHKQVPVYHMWDDHEVVNNWYPGEKLVDDDRYTEKDVNTLASNAKQAFVDCLPINDAIFTSQALYRHVSRGPLLDLFFIDLRSYKGKNSENEQKKRSAETDFFGAQQLNWLKQALLASKGLWKIICIDMPISVLVKEWGTNISENAANSDGHPAGRELEYVELLSFIKQHDIRNLHFITADVHYCASYHCSPKRAAFKDFKPFWEFISGPLHAGTFGPNTLDNTFGPKAEFIGLPDKFEPGSSPAAGLQFFGEINIDASSRTLSVAHFNRVGEKLWETTLAPE